MATEQIRCNSFTGTGTGSATNVTGDDSASTYATLDATGTMIANVVRTGIAAFGSKSNTWTSYVFHCDLTDCLVTVLNHGGGGELTDVAYSTDGATYTSFENGATFPIACDTGALTLYSNAVNSDPTMTNLRVKIIVTSVKGQGSPVFESGDTIEARPNQIYVVGTYSVAPTVTSLNSGSYCNIGSSYNIVGTFFTGATSVSINGYSCSFSVTNSTTISVTIPAMYITSNQTNVSVSVTTPDGTGSANVGNINVPTVSAISPAITAITQSGTQQFSTTIGSVNPTTAHWYATQQSGTGSITTGGLWTAPSSPLAHGYTSTISVWPQVQQDAGYSVPNANLSVNVYYSPSITSLVAPTRVTSGQSGTITPTFSYGDGSPTPHLGTTADGTQISANAVSTTGYSTGTLSSNTTFYLYIRNPAGTVASTSTTVTVVAAPSITSLIATAPHVTTGGSTTITPTFSNPDISPGGHNYLGTTSGGSEVTAAAVSTTGYGTGTLTTNTTYYLHLQNNADTPATATTSVLVQVWDYPSASIVSNGTSPLYGYTGVTVTPTWTGPGGGAYLGTTGYGTNDIATDPSSGVALAVYNTGAGFTAAKTFYLESRNAANTVADASVTVTPQTVTIGAITGNAYQTVSTSQTFTGASVSGAYVPTTVWTSGGVGTWSGAQWTAPASPGGPYTITATAYANGYSTGVTATKQVTVVAAPVATSVGVSTTSPLYGATITITPTFSNSTSATLGSGGYGTSDISAAPVSGTPYTSPAITSAKTYYLQVTNAAGTVAQVASSTVTPQTVVVSAINSGSRTRVYRTHTISLSATVSGASNSNVNWSCPQGSFSSNQTASGVATVWTAPSVKGTYIITATSAGNGAVNSTLNIEVITGSGKKATDSFT